ncbi:RNA polymerase sigma factor [Sphingomonas colocasiae]|uniref:Sigma-70 family RNA polymerase sigma factor n=1 Tax=Sphingomonas colocasiae TaxID=1848973 RepID=A0ABS7PS39_9SPHN|nr:sigma-70 family RNA polymerase sigma factor [Sphingomonas colocasiae]MBY8824153.1 sigma-70 family RNA polymerase sigma factor [Sphingomonas colocasiae]
MASIDRAYRPVLLRYFLRRTDNHAEAEDLTQEVFVRLARTDLSVLDAREAYIFQTASNLLRDRARRAKVRSLYIEDKRWAPDAGIDPLDPHRIAEGNDMLACLFAGLEELPEQTRHIFTLYRIERVAKKTIAAKFGVCESTVDKHIARAMGFLTSKLGHRR